MAADLTVQMFESPTKILPKIDQAQELIPCATCEAPAVEASTTEPVLLSNFPTVGAAPRVRDVPGVSFMQEVKPITCQVQNGDTSMESLTIDAKDKELRVQIKGETFTYLQVRFLDRAVMFRGDKDWILVQIQEDRSVFALRGNLYSLKESLCEDVGAEKSCTLTSGEKLLWNSERLEWQEKGRAHLKLNVVDYGHYPNDGTYFLAGPPSDKKSKQESLLLLDFGANFEVLRGHRSQLKCR